MQQVAQRKMLYQQHDLTEIETSPITQAEWQAAKVKARLS